MQAIATEIPDVLVIHPDVFADERGYFFESYNQAAFTKLGIRAEFKQDNQSKSGLDVLRGLHFQHPPFEQGKLVRVSRGRVFDVAVDIRRGSPWFGKWVGRELSEENKLMMWIPPGFAHGFIVKEENTVFVYKCTEIYNKESEGSIRWDDPQLSIDWGCESPIVSAKDSRVPFLSEIISPFVYVTQK